MLTSELKTCGQPAYICYYRDLMEVSFLRCIVSSVVCNLSRRFNRDRVPSTIFSCRQIQIRQNISLEPLKIFMHYRVVTWYMGSGLKAQNMTGIRAQRKGLRAQKNGIRDHKAFEPESGIRFITRSKNILSQYYIVFPRNKVCVQ